VNEKEDGDRLYDDNWEVARKVEMTKVAIALVSALFVWQGYLPSTLDRKYDLTAFMQHRASNLAF